MSDDTWGLPHCTQGDGGPRCRLTGTTNAQGDAIFILPAGRILGSMKAEGSGETVRKMEEIVVPPPRLMVDDCKAKKVSAVGLHWCRPV